MFDTKIEEYLAENQGNLSSFYDLVSSGNSVGHALRIALCRPDIYRLRRASKYEGLLNETEFDSAKILEILEWLKEDAKNYSDDHPLWSLR